MSQEHKREELGRLRQRLTWVAVCVWGLVAIAAVQQAAAAEEVAEPFNGEDLTGWIAKDHPENESYWTVGSASLDSDDPRALVVGPGNELVNARGHGVDLYSEAVWGDHIIEVEVMVPRGSNSGIYVHGEYEVQVLDSYGREEEAGSGDMGGIYGANAPTNPRYVPPGEWSRFRIEFQAPRFNDAGEKVENAVFRKVELNGRVIHEDVEMSGPTPSGVDGREKAEGPIMFQGDHGPVSYRNLRVRPLD